MIDIIENCERQSLKTMLNSLPDMAGSEVSLKTLRDVEMTVDSLAGFQRILDHFTDAAQYIAEIFIEGSVPREIDPKGKAEERFLKAKQTLFGAIKTLEAGRRSAFRDPKLNGDHEDSVVLEYEAAIEKCRELITAFEHVRIVVREHDADAADSLGSFNNAKDLIAALNED